LKLIVDLFYEGGLEYMNYSVSDTAEYGGYSRGPRVVTPAVKAEMQRILGEVQSGAFAREWIQECETGGKAMTAYRVSTDTHPLEQVGRRLRGMMQWLRPKAESDTAASPMDRTAAEA
jgi:ketol-acid reductoisomerase